MSYSAIIEYVKAVAKLYFKGDKNEKTQLLNHASKITGRHRKSLIRILKNPAYISNQKKLNCGAKEKYPEAILIEHIKYLWISMERISGRRMKAALKDWLPLYNINGVNNEIKYLLEKMSASTLERFLKKLRMNEAFVGKGLSSTSPARYMKNKVPINTLDSVILTPGYAQADTVAHCGDRLEGQFMNSITVTDIFSTWTENRAIYTKKKNEVQATLEQITKELPFKLLAINTDSGSEFLNVPVYNMYKRNKIQFTRSRPYKKNDNCYVEQKNFTHTRELFGYQRFEHEELKDLMNEIYKEYWNPLQNYFLPTFKIKEKIRIGAKIKKTYGPPITPYERLINSQVLTQDQKSKLINNKNSLNPFELKLGLERKLSHFFDKLTELNRTKDQKE